MIESLKKYVLLGVLISCLGLVLYAMPERSVLHEEMMSSDLQVKPQSKLRDKKQNPLEQMVSRHLNSASL
ncbi:MAG TPA: hypothetical protein ENI68_05530 [Gammaproteobacteria bacterium]|nr:hypothetical protein [Gammaproteobacteria bacterium]